MANTLELGNGKWATGKDTVLAFNDENNNFKPLPFSFSRASSGTVVNKDGLIETVGSGEPRIDFKDNTKGALLLEPQRMNYWTYSEGSAITLNSPLGEFGFYTLNNTFISRTITYVGTINFTFIIKKIDGTIPTITTSSGSGDLVVLVNGSSSAGVAGVLTDIGNGFYKYELTREANGASVARIVNQSGLDTYVSLIQYEDGSYATSYIPTSGSAVTRSADSCDNGGNEQVFNDNEGVLYVEVSALADDRIAEGISISDGTIDNRVVIFKWTTTNSIKVRVASGGTNYFDKTISVSDITTINKIAIKYKQNDFSLWVNGIELETDTSGITPIGLSKLNINGATSPSAFKGNVKDVRVYNTALTNAELQALTQ